MNKAEMRQCTLDVGRLWAAANRLDKLNNDYAQALNDLKIARNGLKTIATWASCLRIDDAAHDAKNIHDRAMDTLSLITYD